MNAGFSPSELVINPDGSIYHLHLQEDQLADWVITVGDPDRVGAVSRHFDRIDTQVQKREFVTHTGELGNKRITVISTGIGPDNIDIVLNELDALANIDLQQRIVRPAHRRLHFIRLGTSGSLQPDIEVGSLVFSAYGLGLDNLMSYYQWQTESDAAALLRAFRQFVDQEKLPLPVSMHAPYAVEADERLLNALSAEDRRGITLTAPGFYAPQGRQLRAPGRLTAADMHKLADFGFGSLAVTNLEMETAAIYGLAQLMGHAALSCNVILAGRRKGQFSSDPQQAVEDMITTMLARISEL